jgi:hypothetical protein
VGVPAETPPEKEKEITCDEHEMKNIDEIL